jgi:hypothetical protein
MRLFNMDTDSFELSFDPEVLTIREFNKIIKRDRSPGKVIAIAELSYIWFFCDYKSDFVQIIDEGERSIEIINSLGALDAKKWKVDSTVQAGIDKYKSLSTTITSRMLEDARSIVDNMSKWAKNAALNLDEMVGDRPRYDISKVQAFIRDLPKMQDTLNSLEDKVLREKDSSDAHRGSQEKSMLEDDI